MSSIKFPAQSSTPSALAPAASLHPSTSLCATPSFQALQVHYETARNWRLRTLFAEDAERFTRFSLEAAGIFLDYSKNRLNQDTLRLLFALAREREVEAQRDAMCAGAKVNVTEGRAALHTALRAPRGETLYLDGHDVMADIHTVLARMKSFSEQVRSGQWLGYSGKAITDVVNIGIGGSDLGPQMVCHALRVWQSPHLTLHFVSNIDGHDLEAVLSKVKPETTLFIVASKSFTTADTMINARSARAWFLRDACEADLVKHFVATSANADAVAAFGIASDNLFPLWDWVGGRYSVWSAIGLPIALAVGFERFSEWLDGARQMDQHFRTAPLENNMPVILALLGVWYRNFFGVASTLTAPYHQDLSEFPAYLQQLEMESNGKRVMWNGQPLDVASCPIVWGGVGTSGQHAYFQLLHQGTDMAPVDFIVALRPSHRLPEHHLALLANCFAQAEALMLGRTMDTLQSTGADVCLSEAALRPHKAFPGNRPSNMIVLDEGLTPAALGALMALYEHKVFVQGALWGINSFDQWGVELGKVLAQTIQQELTDGSHLTAHDGSTNGLIARACRHMAAD